MKAKQESRARPAGRPLAWWVGGLALLVVAGLAVYRLTTKPAAPAAPSPAKLVGRWLRPDGGYILQLSAPDANGLLKAEYFNPRPINVSRAEWKHQEGHLGVFVELRAPNYPGSTYTLAYDPAQDRLVGIYFQAAMQQQFDVVFERTPRAGTVQSRRSGPRWTHASLAGNPSSGNAMELPAFIQYSLTQDKMA